jgi:hypothetical protein
MKSGNVSDAIKPKRKSRFCARGLQGRDQDSQCPSFHTSLALLASVDLTGPLLHDWQR